MLLLTKYIARHELAPLSRFIDLADVLDGAEKVSTQMEEYLATPSSTSHS
ncbi:MAG: hypothetical protein WC846_01330 [Candidatus Gracilibacteria bacterium]|jgi:hypothetical protein